MLNHHLSSLLSVTFNRFGSLLPAPKEVNPQALIDHATKQAMAPIPRSKQAKVKNPSHRKLHRTTKAEVIYGRNLRAHFDRNRLTRSQLKKFYAGKLV